MTDIHNAVREIITALIPNKPAHLIQVGSGQRLDVLGFDSLDRFEIAVKIDQEFSIDLDDGVPDAWATVQDVIDSVLNELGRASDLNDLGNNPLMQKEMDALAKQHDETMTAPGNSLIRRTGCQTQD